jgi:RNA polymerase sigma-70 factor (ECF subfamily)
MRFIKPGKKSSKSDEELIAGYRSGNDPVVIEILFERFSHLVFAVSMKYLKNEEDSKDVVIAVFEKLPNDLIKYNIQNFSSWLHSVTKNHCLRFLSRKKKFTIDTEKIPDLFEEEDEGFSAVYLPYLNESIGQLNDDQKTCIELFYLQNMTYKEVSEQTRFNLNEVKSHIQNGKRNLKIILQKINNDTK